MHLTTREQMEKMRQKWPEFRVLAATNWYVNWEGSLQSLSMHYTVRVSMCFGMRLSNVDIMGFPPRVTVVNPLLRRRSAKPDDPIPHIYPNTLCSECPILCLYLPCSDEWSPRDAVADKIIPWTINWLACYEGWLATGEWTGGGAHHT